MSQRFLSTGLVVLGALLLLCAVAGWFRSESATLLVDPDLELKAVQAGQRRLVTFVIRNPADHAVRVVGLEQC